MSARRRAPACSASIADMAREPRVDRCRLLLRRNVRQCQCVFAEGDLERGSALARAPGAERVDQSRQTAGQAHSELGQRDRIALFEIRRQ